MAERSGRGFDSPHLHRKKPPRSLETGAVASLEPESAADEVEFDNLSGAAHLELYPAVAHSITLFEIRRQPDDLRPGGDSYRPPLAGGAGRGPGAPGRVLAAAWAVTHPVPLLDVAILLAKIYHSLGPGGRPVY